MQGLGRVVRQGKQAPLFLLSLVSIADAFHHASILVNLISLIPTHSYSLQGQGSAAAAR